MIEYVAETDSTNSYLRSRLLQEPSLPEGFSVLADYQTAGRGQAGNYWESARCQNLLFSLLLRPSFLEAEKQFLLSESVSIAIVRVLNQLKSGFSIKWPNDIYFEEKKIAGILIETDWIGQLPLFSIVGIGLNVNQIEFQSSAPNPVSLRSVLGRIVSREELYEQLLNTLIEQYSRLACGDEASIRGEYAEYLYRREGFFGYRDAEGSFEAAIRSVDPSGKLHLCLRDGSERAYYFKEVAFL